MFEHKKVFNTEKFGVQIDFVDQRVSFVSKKWFGWKTKLCHKDKIESKTLRVQSPVYFMGGKIVQIFLMIFVSILTRIEV